MERTGVRTVEHVVTVGVGTEWISADRNLFTIEKSVTIGVRILFVGICDLLVRVTEAVSISIFRFLKPALPR